MDDLLPCRLVTLCAKFCHSKVIHNFGWMLTVYGFRAASQAIYIVMLTRALAVDQFGAFAASIATASLVSPFATWGCGYLLIRSVSRSTAQFGPMWRKGLFVTCSFGGFGAVAVALAGHLLVTSSMTYGSWLLVAASELILSNLVQLSSQAFIALDRHSGAARANAALLICRLAGAGLFFHVVAGSLVAWSWIYLVSSAIGAATALLDVRISISWGSAGSIAYEWRDGAYFAFGLSSQSMINDLDKALLARIDTLAATAIYAAAYRVVGVAFLPTLALMTTFFGRFFRAGRGRDADGSRKLAFHILPYSAALGALCSLALYLGSAGLPALFGPEYAASVDAVRLLSLVPFIKSIQYFGADGLSGADRQGLRTLIQIAGVVLNVFLVVVLVRESSWRGAAIATLITEAALAFGMWIALLTIGRVGKTVGSDVNDVLRYHASEPGSKR